MECNNRSKQEGEAAGGAQKVPVTANGSSGAAAAAASAAAASAAAAEQPGQLVEVKFRAPKAGKYDLTLFCISGAHRLSGGSFTCIWAPVAATGSAL